MARRGRPQTGARRTAPRHQRRGRDRDDAISVLARAVREVEAAAERGRVTPSVRTKFQVIALLLREERARIRAEETTSDARRAEQLKRLDGIATLLARTAVRDPALLALLSEDAVVTDAARSLKRDMLRAAGIEPAPDETRPPEPTAAPAATERRVVPQSVVSRQLANPFLAPDFSAPRPSAARPRRLAGWELLGPLLRSFERAAPGAPACMALPAPSSLHAAGGLELMPHQAQVVAAAAAGHRTFLLAERHRWSPLGSLLSHAALGLFVLGMGVVTPRFGSEAILKVPVGESRPVGFPGQPGNLLVRNEAFVARWDPDGIPVEYRTRLTVFRDGAPIAEKDLLVNDPLSVGGYTIHPNFFGPAVDVILRDATGRILYSGAVVLDGQASGMPEGLLRIPGTDTAVDFLLRSGEGGIAELLTIGLGPAAAPGAAPVVLFQAILEPGDGFLATVPPVGVEFVRPSSYIGLIAKHDPGQGLIWLGGILLVTGLTISLGLPRRRLWIQVRPDETRVVAIGSGPFALDEVPALLARLGGRPRYG